MAEGIGLAKVGVGDNQRLAFGPKERTIGIKPQWY
jgi:hypothetical protein